jgi:hypothetical protein
VQKRTREPNLILHGGSIKEIRLAISPSILCKLFRATDKPWRS